MALSKPASAWTYEDLFALPDDGTRYEIIEGELYEMPSPGSAHAMMILKLILAIHPLISRLGGELMTAPLEVFFAGANPVQPDILAILPGSLSRIVPRGVEGPPELIVEVLSRSNRGHDLLTKRALYARAGVREYWIGDPEARTVEIFALDRDALHLVVAAAGRDMPVSPLLGPLPVAADALLPTMINE